MLSKKKTVNYGGNFCSHCFHIHAKGCTMKYPVLLEKGVDGWIVASCPSIQGCISQGRTREEALTNIGEAITLMLEAIEDEGWEKPLEPVLKVLI